MASKVYPITLIRFLAMTNKARTDCETCIRTICKGFPKFLLSPVNGVKPEKWEKGQHVQAVTNVLEGIIGRIDKVRFVIQFWK